MIARIVAALLVVHLAACSALSPALDTAALAVTVTESVATALDELPPTATTAELKLALADALEASIAEARADATESGKLDPTTAGGVGVGLSALAFLLARYRKQLLNATPPKIAA